MPANGRRGRPQGKCHRKQTAAANAAARVKGWGKSPPRDWQQERHGKPHREQDRIGAVRRETFEGCFRPTARVGCVRRMATCVQDEWPPRSRAARREGHTEPGLQASWRLPISLSNSKRLRRPTSLLVQVLAWSPSVRAAVFLETGTINRTLPKAQEHVMGQVGKRSITLSPELAAAVDDVVAAGEYASASEVIREAQAMEGPARPARLYGRGTAQAGARGDRQRGGTVRVDG